jgi:PTS system nitrogen regulatory IIA component
MDVSDFLEDGAIALRVSAGAKRQALMTLADIAGRHFGLPSPAILDALSAREAAGSTGVGYGVAVPHARLEGLGRMRAVFMRLDHPVAFDAVDDQPVDLMFALFAPPNAMTDHLRALARVSRLLRQPDLRQQLRQAKSVDAIRALLVQEARPTAA